MLLRNIIYLLLFCFCTWLALTTRYHPNLFPAIIATYGGDIIWAGMFLFLLRIFFSKTKLWKLAVILYAVGVINELLQLYHAPWIEELRKTKFGWMMLGYGFMWSDIVCYAIGIFIAYWVVVLIERMSK